MSRLGLLGSVATSVAVAVGADWFSLSDWGFQQKRALFEAFDSRGFPYPLGKTTSMFMAANSAFNDLKSLGVLPSAMLNDSDLTRHIFVSCTRDGNSLSTYGNDSWAIGFPLFFLNTSADKVNRSAVRLRHSFTYLWARRNKRDESAHTFERRPLTESQWNSDAGQDLLKSLTAPNPAAQKFVAARQLILATRYEKDAHINALGCGSIPITIYGIVKLMKSSLKQQALPRGVYFVFYSLATVLVSAAAVTAFDFRRCSIERSVDTSAAKLSPEYAEGGVNYYNQLLAQNRALRQLQADANDWKAAQTVSAIGDPLTFIRQKSLPLSTRRDICVTISENFGTSKTAH